MSIDVGAAAIGSDAVTKAAPTLTQAEALERLAKHFAPHIAARRVPNIVEWAEKNYYIPETSQPIKLEPCQKTFLNFAMHSSYQFITVLYSTIKKSGKTAVAGCVGRYVGEFSGPKAEVYFVANDKEQAKDRAYESAKTSITLDPKYNKQHRTLAGSWRIIERQSVHEPTDSIMRAIASDYEGSAGGNPSLTCWTELWGFTLERFKRLWDELTPVPTRKRSMRWVETYAGFEDESELLLDLYRLGMRGRRVTYDELKPYAVPAGSDPWPYADKDSIPIFINEDARMLTYWDTGVAARRMPWQQGPEGDAYYREQATQLRPEAFDRLHYNYWQNSVNEFIPIQWWQACKSSKRIEFPRDYEMVVSVDASVSGDCTAITGVSRHPDPALHDEHAVLRESHVWHPEHGNTIDYRAVKDELIRICRDGNVVQVPYDAYQLHGMMQELTRDGVAWCKSFSQASNREIADKRLYDMIRGRKIHHYDEIDEQFIRNAAAYTAAGAASSSAKIERMRLVKKSKDAHIDPIVALSMATHECMRLLL